MHLAQRLVEGLQWFWPAALIGLAIGAMGVTASLVRERIRAGRWKLPDSRA